MGDLYAQASSGPSLPLLCPFIGSAPSRILYDLESAAAAVSLSPHTLRKAIRTTDPPAFPPPLWAKRAGSKYVILATELERWANALPNA